MLFIFIQLHENINLCIKRLINYYKTVNQNNSTTCQHIFISIMDLIKITVHILIDRKPINVIFSYYF